MNHIITPLIVSASLAVAVSFWAGMGTADYFAKRNITDYGKTRIHNTVYACTEQLPPPVPLSIDEAREQLEEKKQ